MDSSIVGEQVLTPRKVFGYNCNVHAIIAPVIFIAFRVHTWVILMTYFSPMVICLAPSTTVKASQ